MHITDHIWMNPVDFGEYRTNSFFLQEYKKEFLYITANSLKSSSIQTVHSIDLKYSMYIMRHYPTYYVDFGEFKINSFYIGVQNFFLIHCSLWGQIIRSMLMYMQRFRLSSNLMCAL